MVITHMIRIPRPEVRKAILVNAKTGRPTVHKYVETIECMLPLRRASDKQGDYTGGPAWQFLFECQMTGIQRVWGVEDRAPSSFDRCS